MQSLGMKKPFASYYGKGFLNGKLVMVQIIAC